MANAKGKRESNFEEHEEVENVEENRGTERTVEYEKEQEGKDQKGKV